MRVFRTFLIFWREALGLFVVLLGIACFLLPNWLGLFLCFVISLVYLVMRSALHWWSQTIWENRGRDFFAELGTPTYIAWQQEVLETLYSDLDIAAVYGRRYPAAIIRPARIWQYPFEGLCKLTDVSLPTVLEDREQRNYLRLLGPSLKWPKMKGFALRRIPCDDRGRAEAIEAVVTNFRQNVVTSHILEWELYQFYASGPAIQSGPAASVTAAILDRLPRRAAYHAGRPAHLAVLEPASAYPLISLQAMVVFRDFRTVGKPTWRIVTARRSKEVVIKPGYFQFHPAGGFEVYGSEDDSEESLVREGFDVRMALFREYAEELFDAKHLQVRPDGRDAKSVLADPNVRQLMDLIEDGKASLDYLGIVIDLSVLRHELSFLILIDDKSFCNNPLLGSWEAKNIQTPSASELPTVLATGPLHGSSAALLQLAMESEHLRNLGISMDLTRSAK